MTFCAPSFVFVTHDDFSAEKRVDFLKKNRQPVEIAHSIEAENVLPGVVYVLSHYGRIGIAPVAEMIGVKAAKITRTATVEKCVYVSAGGCFHAAVIGIA